MKVVVLYGDTEEREVSLRSVRAVADAARHAGFDVVEYDLAQDNDALEKIKADWVVLPISHGAGWEDGTIQAELEKRGLKYLGSKSKASKMCFDKALFLEHLRSVDIPTAQGAEVSRGTYVNHPLSKKPHVLKVARGGSSIGTVLIRDPANVDMKHLETEVFTRDEKAILEELVEGVEVTVGVFGEEALPVVEIRPPEGGEFDYENKYNGATAELIPPENVSEEHQKAAQELALKTHKTMGCRHLSRTDIIIRPDGSMVVLDTNTIPGMTNQSLYPKEAAAIGLGMPELVKKFIQMVSAAD